MKKIWKRLPKWGKILVWVLAGIVGLVLLFIFGFMIWILTWKTYTNDEFGFSFRYPAGWHIGGTDITKKQLDDKNVVFFWVDSKPENEVSQPYDTARSPGNVEVWIETDSLTMQAHSQEINSPRTRQIKYGKYFGYTYEGAGGPCKKDDIGSIFRCIPYGGVCCLKYLVLSRSVDLVGNYYYYINSVTYTEKMDVFSILYANYYNWVGAKIISSFNFYK